MKKILKNIFVIFCVCSLLLFPLTLSTAAEEDEQTRQDPNGATTRRALVISAPLEGGLENCEWQGMQSMFVRNGISTSSALLRAGNGNAELYNKITTTFAAADTNDVSYVYINSHGERDGSLYLDGLDYTTLDLETLRFKLDGIYGRVILMIDACYSGNAIQRGESTDLPAESISQSMLDTFLDCDLEPSRSGEFADRKKYVVYCACRAGQTAGFIGICGAATYSWAYTGGYRIDTETGIGSIASWDEQLPANSIFSAEEYFLQSRTRMRNEYGFSQTMCYYTPSVYRTVFTTDYELGDINKDWYIGTPDVLALRNHISESQVLTGRAAKLADLTQDGAINLQDLLALRQFIADM